MFDENGVAYLDCINNVAHGKYFSHLVLYSNEIFMFSKDNLKMM